MLSLFSALRLIADYICLFFWYIVWYFSIDYIYWWLRLHITLYYDWLFCFRHYILLLILSIVVILAYWLRHWFLLALIRADIDDWHWCLFIITPIFDFRHYFLHFRHYAIYYFEATWFYFRHYDYWCWYWLFFITPFIWYLFLPLSSHASISTDYWFIFIFDIAILFSPLIITLELFAMIRHFFFRWCHYFFRGRRWYFFHWLFHWLRLWLLIRHFFAILMLYWFIFPPFAFLRCHLRFHYAIAIFIARCWYYLFIILSFRLRYAIVADISIAWLAIRYYAGFLPFSLLWYLVIAALIFIIRYFLLLLHWCTYCLRYHWHYYYFISLSFIFIAIISLAAITLIPRHAITLALLLLILFSLLLHDDITCHIIAYYLDWYAAIDYCRHCIDLRCHYADYWLMLSLIDYFTPLFLSLSLLSLSLFSRYFLMLYLCCFYYYYITWHWLLTFYLFIVPTLLLFFIYLYWHFRDW